MYVCFFLFYFFVFYPSYLCWLSSFRCGGKHLVGRNLSGQTDVSVRYWLLCFSQSVFLCRDNVIAVQAWPGLAGCRGPTDSQNHPQACWWFWDLIEEKHWVSGRAFYVLWTNGNWSVIVRVGPGGGLDVGRCDAASHWTPFYLAHKDFCLRKQTGGRQRRHDAHLNSETKTKKCLAFTATSDPSVWCHLCGHTVCCVCICWCTNTFSCVHDLPTVHMATDGHRSDTREPRVGAEEPGMLSVGFWGLRSRLLTVNQSHWCFLSEHLLNRKLIKQLLQPHDFFSTVRWLWILQN